MRFRHTNAPTYRFRSTINRPRNLFQTIETKIMTHLIYKRNSSSLRRSSQFSLRIAYIQMRQRFPLAFSLKSPQVNRCRLWISNKKSIRPSEWATQWRTKENDNSVENQRRTWQTTMWSCSCYGFNQTWGRCAITWMACMTHRASWRFTSEAFTTTVVSFASRNNVFALVISRVCSHRNCVNFSLNKFFILNFIEFRTVNAMRMSDKICGVWSRRDIKLSKIGWSNTINGPSYRSVLNTESVHLFIE